MTTKLTPPVMVICPTCLKWVKYFYGAFVNDGTEGGTYLLLKLDDNVCGCERGD